MKIDSENIKLINTSSLRKIESYVTQGIFIFNDKLGNNIGIANLTASYEIAEKLRKKDSIHDFMMSLLDGYDTKASALLTTLSRWTSKNCSCKGFFIWFILLIFG
jgi:ATP-binding cassette subfamily C protein